MNYENMDVIEFHNFINKCINTLGQHTKTVKTLIDFIKQHPVNPLVNPMGM